MVCARRFWPSAGRPEEYESLRASFAKLKADPVKKVRTNWSKLSTRMIGSPTLTKGAQVAPRALSRRPSSSASAQGDPIAARSGRLARAVRARDRAEVPPASPLADDTLYWKALLLPET